MTEDKKGTWEELKVAGEQLVETVRELIREGNVRRIIVKDEGGKTFLEIPLTVGVIGTLVAPLAAALGALAAMVKGLTLDIEKVEKVDTDEKEE